MNKQIILSALLVTALFLMPRTSRARYLNVDTGRFQTMDTFAGDNEDPLSLHKYLYCHDNPVNGTDPSGHDDFTLPSITLAGGIGASIDAIDPSATFRAFLWAALKTATIATALELSQDRGPYTTYYHYSTSLPFMFANGLWPDSSATTIPRLNAYEASAGLGIPLPRYEYPVTINPSVTPVTPPTPVPANKYGFGGLPEVFFQVGTPPGSVGPPIPVQ